MCIRDRHGAGRGRDAIVADGGDVAEHVVGQAGQVERAATDVVDDDGEDDRAARRIQLRRVGGLDDLNGRIGDDIDLSVVAIAHLSLIHI